MSGRILVVEHETDADLSLMQPVFGDRAVVVRPYLGDAVPDPVADGGWSGLVVLGGSMAAWEDDVAPWLPATRRIMAGAVGAGLPTLGICLGAQLLALACGGEVSRGSAGLELGTTIVTPLKTVAADPLLGPVAVRVGPRWAVRQYHLDAVTGLPADAELLATGRPYPHQAFRVGAAAWGVQYHPEVSTDLFGSWVRHGLASGEIPAEADRRGPARFSEAAQSVLAQAHAGAFLDIVDAGRRPARSLTY